LHRRRCLRPLADPILQLIDRLSLALEGVFEVADATAETRLRHETDDRQDERKGREKEHPEDE